MWSIYSLALNCTFSASFLLHKNANVCGKNVLANVLCLKITQIDANVEPPNLFIKSSYYKLLLAGTNLALHCAFSMHNIC